MSTRLLILSATAFALGVSSSALMAQEGSSGNGNNNASSGNERRPAWRPNQSARPQRATQPRSAPGAIRVLGPDANRNSNANEGGIVLPNSGGNNGTIVTGTNTGGNGNGNRTAGPQYSSVATVPPPPNERRSGMGRFRPRAGLNEPQGFSSRVDGGRKVFLAWDDRAGNETTYVVQRRRAIEANGRGQWGPVEEVVLQANSEAFSDEPSEPGNYAYRVASANTQGRSWFSSWMTMYLSPAAFVAQPEDPNANVEQNQNNNAGGNGGNGGNGNNGQPTPTPPPEPPSMPVGASAADAGQRRALVRWNAVAGATGYQIERSPAMPGGTALLASDATEFTDGSGVGTFEYRIRALGAGVAGRYTSWMSVDVADVLPAAPSGVSVVHLGDSERVRLQWTDNADNETAFRLERQTRDGASWTTTTSLVLPANRVEQVDMPGPGTHRYRLVAEGASGASFATDWAEVIVPTMIDPNGGPTLMPPTAPSSVGAAAQTGARARVTWADMSADETGFDIERSPAFGEGRIALPANASQYVDNSGPGTFQYRIRAVNGTMASDWSAWASVVVAVEVPAGPSGLTALHQGDHERVTLGWQDNSANETGFRIERQARVGTNEWGPVRVILTTANATTQVDEPGPGSFRYRVAALNSAGASSYTGWTLVEVPLPPVDPMTIPPATPGNIGASDQERRASVMWSDVSANELGFELEREPAFASRVLLGTNVTGYMDNCGPGTMRYRVRSFNNAGYSDWSEWATVQVSETAPTAPGDLSGADLGNQEDVSLSWGDNSFNELAFRVERTPWINNAWGTPVATLVEANATSHLDSPGLGKFRYRVQAINDGGESTWSNESIVSVTDGWTQVLPSSDTREVFVSSSMGNDTNTGLSPDQPVRTLLRGYQLLRDNMPDHMRLRKGDAWTNEVVGPFGQHGAWDKNGRSAAEPMVIYTYGDSPNRPLLRTGQKDRAIMMMGDGVLGNIAFIGLHFQAHTRMINDPDYVPNDGGQNPPVAVFVYGRGANFLFEDCKFDSYAGHMQFQVPLDKLAEGWTLENIHVRRSVLVDAYAGVGTHSSGVFASNVDGLIFDECVLDHNGWSASVPNRPSTIFNHNFYLVGNCNNVVVKNTITARASATGIQMRGRSMHAFNNLALKNPLGITTGHAMAAWPAEGWTGSMKYNVILDGADIGVQGQPSFAPRGFGIVFGRSINGVIEHNIVAHNTSARGVEPAIWTELPSSGITIRDNVLYNWTGVMDRPFRGGLFRLDTSLPDGAVIEDNVFQQPVSGFVNQIRTNMNGPGGQWARNRYFSAGNPETQWFVRGADQPYNFASWIQRTNEVGAQTTPASFPDPSRTIGAYMASLGLEPTLEAFLREARLQSRSNWRPEFTAAAVNRWIREGFGMGEPDPSLANPPAQPVE